MTIKKFLAAALVLLCAARAAAVPADPTPAIVAQPDGSQLTITLQGDEFYHFTTTADGYTVVKNSNGYYYATLDANGALTASSTVAHDAAQRTAAEQALLNKLGKRLVASDAATTASARRAAMQGPSQKIKTIDYAAFKGLVVLVNYQDVKFTRSDLAEFYNNMLNTRNYTGYTNEDGTTNPYGKCTGSVRDYYYDNSMGKFDPQFDIVGPVTIDCNSTEMYGTSSTARSNLATALEKLDSAKSIDFSKYDTDNDGVVDMVYFIVAGHGANVTGNNSDLLWPHKWQFPSLYLGGKRIYKYACSTELNGAESTNVLDGIGTICHEFSHVLGLPDVYDTDYEKSGGLSHHPGPWDLMANGCYLNRSRTPAGYSAWERYTLGFMTPKRINGELECELNPILQSNEAYILPTPDSREYFTLENRQFSKWDYYLPGHGLLVIRVDSTESWSSGVNINPAHNHYELLRAGNSLDNGSASDTYPGTQLVTMISNFTTPNLRQWNGTANEYLITDIAETNGVITFKTKNANDIKSYIETFENMPVTTVSQKGVEGEWATWNFTRSQVVATDSTKCSGSHSVAMQIPGVIETTTPLETNAIMVGIDVYNTSSTLAKFILEYKDEADSVWMRHSTIAEAPADSVTSIKWALNKSGKLLFRIQTFAGPKNGKVWVDNVSVYGSAIPAGIDGVAADSDKSLTVGHTGLAINVAGAKAGSRISLYGVGGSIVATATANDQGQASLEAPQRGFYVVSDGTHATKVAL